MGNNNEKTRVSFLFLIAIANLLAAFGGGTVLYKAINLALEKEAFRIGTDDAFIALLIGTTIGLVLLGLLNWIRSKWARSSRVAGGCLSFMGAVTAILLARVYEYHFKHSNDLSAQLVDLDLLCFWALLALLFSLLFVPRILRSDAAAGDKQKIGWVEFCYATGVVLALVSWPRLNSLVPDLQNVLYIDAAFQIWAGLFDIISSRMVITQAPQSSTGTSKSKQRLPLNWGLYTKITIAIIALTVGIQIVALEFRLALGKDLSPYIFGGFYLGAAVAALIYSMVGSKLEFPQNRSYAAKFGILTVALRDKKSRLPFPLVSTMAALPLLLAITGNAYLIWTCSAREKCYAESWVAQALLVLSVMMAAFLYEWLALAIFDMIGKEAKEKNREGLVAMTFGLMGIGGTMFVILLSKFKLGVPGHISWIVTLIGCIIVTNLAVGLTKKALVSSPAT